MKEGAADFLSKPVDADHLLLVVGRALESANGLGSPSTEGNISTQHVGEENLERVSILFHPVVRGQP